VYYSSVVAKRAASCFDILNTRVDVSTEDMGAESF